MVEVPLKCSCGNVRGVAHQVVPNAGNHIICCCDDCQAFAGYLGREREILDEYGGTEIFQMPIARVEIAQGIEEVRCVRLSDRGIFRWYTECCKTPIGNSLGASVPFLGLISSFIDDGGDRARNLGPVLAYLYAQFATKPPPQEQSHTAVPLKIVARGLGKILLWKLQGLHRPSAFFDSEGNAIAEPVVLSLSR